ncbi:MAG: peptide-methionine (S)-S-oxide reductase MsrA [Marinoscillum sp.]|uniref:peptide-methionine (S)-S-oxide reductase MsrA n=1 Tax=Marinoscillum sp. TaxID=2024838 RepID=UPI0032FAE7A9
MKNLFLILVLSFTMSCNGNSSTTQTVNKLSDQNFSTLDTATFAGGCFWCIEASFEQINGVTEAVSGYAGGAQSNAKYDLVSSGRTKHAETVQIYFNPEVIDYGTLLDIFFTAHDPTQLNRQGPDVGPQYRSAIFYHNQEQKDLAEEKIADLQARFSFRIVTELTPYTIFYEAEAYHQDYEKNHPFNPYIMNVSRPKIDKVKKQFSDRLKKEIRD